MDELSDKKVLKLLLQGDEETIKQWFEAYCDGLYTFAFYRTGRKEAVAGDIVRETFSAALKQIDSFDSKTQSMSAWLVSFSEEFIKKSPQSSSGLQNVVSRPADAEAGLSNCYRRIATEPLPDEVIEESRTAELVQMTLANIASDFKYVLEECYYRMRPLKEIAAYRGVSENEVNALLYNARKAFKGEFLKLSVLPGNGETTEGAYNG